jgi:hypothetical protein
MSSIGSPVPRTKADLIDAIAMHKDIAARWDSCKGVSAYHTCLAMRYDEQLTVLMEGIKETGLKEEPIVSPLEPTIETMPEACQEGT